MEVVIGGAEPPRAVFLEELTKAVVELEPWSEMTTGDCANEDVRRSYCSARD
jgi:hypothetical protein